MKYSARGVTWWLSVYKRHEAREPAVAERVQEQRERQHQHAPFEQTADRDRRAGLRRPADRAAASRRSTAIRMLSAAASTHIARHPPCAYTQSPSVGAIDTASTVDMPQ